jgi:hypothetical protein
LHDLAGEFSVSAERIRQIEVKAMQKMRANLAPLVASMTRREGFASRAISRLMPPAS